MKHLLLIAALLVPGMANASTDLMCQSFSQSGPGPISIHVTSSESILNEGAIVKIVAQGILRSEFDLVASPAFSSAIEQNIRLIQVNAETGEILENGIEALLSLDATSRFEEDGSVTQVLLGSGSIRLLEAPNRGLPRLQPLYSLTDCVGAI